VRVVAGELGGRRLVSPEGRATRPTTERVREAVFNSLGSADVIDGAEFLDLWAGTGALGIEALSRGASRCTFVERDRGAAAVLRDNLRTLGLEGRSRVVVGDAIAAAATPADVVLADPPYGEEPWSELLTAVRADIVVIEGNAAVGAPDWEQWRARRYGRTWVTFLRRMTATPEAM
jgi:16S rRNA (guanine966-N2)-methyltransferase